MAQAIRDAVGVERHRCERIAEYRRDQHGDVASNLRFGQERMTEEAAASVAEAVLNDIRRGWVLGEATHNARRRTQ